MIAMKDEYGIRQLVPCEQNRRACVANKGGRCTILHDTHFEKKPCPFYKTKAMVAAEMKGARHG